MYVNGVWVEKAPGVADHEISEITEQEVFKSFVKILRLKISNV